jgi:hypothetical protein
LRERAAPRVTHFSKAGSLKWAWRITSSACAVGSLLSSCAQQLVVASWPPQHLRQAFAQIVKCAKGEMLPFLHLLKEPLFISLL